MSLTPVQYETKYRQLVARMDSGSVFTLDVHKYKNNASTTPGHSTQQAQTQAKDPLIAKIWEAGRKRYGGKKLPDKFHVTVKTGDAFDMGDDTAMSDVPDPSRKIDVVDFVDVYEVIRTFTGKGSPEDIADTLKWAVRYRLVGASIAKLQKYCDDYIGVDCSGFVVNYANSEMGLDMPETPANAFAPDGKCRSDMDSVCPLDVLCWATTNHVAIIDSLDENRIQFERMKSADGKLKSLVCTVVESNGPRGLGHCNYTLLSVDDNQVFKVKRQDDATEWKVYVASL